MDKSDYITMSHALSRQFHVHRHKYEYLSRKPPASLPTFYHLAHYSDVIMSAMASQITGVVIVYSTVCSGADQRKHQSSASLAFVREIHRGPVNSPHKEPVTRKKIFHVMTSWSIFYTLLMALQHAWRDIIGYWLVVFFIFDDFCHINTRIFRHVGLV